MAHETGGRADRLAVEAQPVLGEIDCEPRNPLGAEQRTDKFDAPPQHPPQQRAELKSSSPPATRIMTVGFSMRRYAGYLLSCVGRAFHGRRPRLPSTVRPDRMMPAELLGDDIARGVRSADCGRVLARRNISRRLLRRQDRSWDDALRRNQCGQMISSPSARVVGWPPSSPTIRVVMPLGPFALCGFLTARFCAMVVLPCRVTRGIYSCYFRHPQFDGLSE